MVLRWLRRRRLSDVARRKLLIAFAHAEDELLETHVENVLDIYKAVGDELTLDRVLDMYIDTMDVAEPQGAIIARTAMARLEATHNRPRRRPRGETR